MADVARIEAADCFDRPHPRLGPFEGPSRYKILWICGQTQHDDGVRMLLRVLEGESQVLLAFGDPVLLLH